MILKFKKPLLVHLQLLYMIQNLRKKISPTDFSKSPKKKYDNLSEPAFLFT